MLENIIILCNCQARKDTQEWSRISGLLTRFDDIHLVSMTDLCGLCALKPEKLLTLVGNAGRVLLIACHPRSVKSLLLRAGISRQDNIRIFNLLEESPDDLLPLILDYRNSGQGASGKEGYVNDQSWPAWYPVIDNTLCTGCGQCAEFCLFGVFQKTGDRVVVVNPKACKNNCPACARICPHIAIIFPKYIYGGAISGSDAYDEVLEMQRLQKDTGTILGNDIYEALEKRKQKRRMVIRQDMMQLAISEREEAFRNLTIE